ncbi:hypothetical protein SAMN05216419_10038 [Nitrosomonas cryotolerans]|nr:hypothetical protein SAMN05216419_10038 [Nitrosomonas cryotolerans]
MEIVIPSKKSRTARRSYDNERYKLRHLVEDASLNLKRWCGIATGYVKNIVSFLVAVQVRCITLWGSIS